MATPGGKRQSLGWAGLRSELGTAVSLSVADDGRGFAFVGALVSATVAGHREAGALNRRAGGEAHKGNRSASSRARSRRRWAPARKASGLLYSTRYRGVKVSVVAKALAIRSMR